MWNDLKRVVEANHRFILSTHHQPDGDGIGSACAFQELLQLLNKRGYLVTSGSISPAFDFLKPDGTEFSHLSPPKQGEVLVVLDSHRPGRVGQLARYAEEQEWPIICIDHHPKVTDWGSFQIIDPSAASVGIMIAELFEAWNLPLTPRAADGIYASIYSDTGRFAHGCQDGRALIHASSCIAMGTDPALVHHHLSNRLSLSSAQLMAKAVAQMEIHCDGQVLVQMFSADDFEALDPQEQASFDLHHLHEFNKLIDDVVCAVVLLQQPNHEVRVSIRCREGIDIGKVMGFMGGGGHARAAGATWRGALQEVKNHILHLIEKELSYEKGAPFS